MSICNEKYEITDIAHGTYSFEDADSWIAMMPSPPMGPVWRAGASSGIKRWSAAKLVFGECP